MKVAPPQTNAPARNPIDNFITARLAAEGLTQAPEADRVTLARRVSLDLTGLPPEPVFATFASELAAGQKARNLAGVAKRLTYEIPNMRSAIMVAVLFRALDAYRIFDNIFVMTKGAEGTQSISFLTYRQVIEQMQLGLGSAMSVLLFLSVLLLAWLIVKLFRVDLAQARGEG